MRALLIHQNFPGQFRHLAQHLVSQNNVEIKAIGRDTAPGLPGLPLIRYTPHRDGAPGVHPYLRTLEAMACGCVVIGSDTAPVREVIRHGKNGYLVDFFDTAALAERLATTLDAWPALDEMRVLARRTVLEHYGVHKGLHAYLQLIKQAAEPFSTDSYIYLPNGKTSSLAEFPMTTIQINGR